MLKTSITFSTDIQILILTTCKQLTSQDLHNLSVFEILAKLKTIKFMIFGRATKEIISDRNLLQNISTSINGHTQIRSI